MKMLKHLFGKRDKELDVLQEEALQSPLRTVVRILPQTDLRLAA